MGKDNKQALRLWLQLFMTAGTMERKIHNAFKKHFDLTLPQFDVLATLDYLGEQTTMGALSEHLLTSNGNVSGIVRRLESQGYIVREKSLKDARTIHVFLSDKGKAFFAPLAKQHAEWVDTLFSDLSPQEMNQSLMLLAKLGTSIDNHKNFGGICETV